MMPRCNEQSFSTQWTDSDITACVVTIWNVSTQFRGESIQVNSGPQKVDYLSFRLSGVELTTADFGLTLRVLVVVTKFIAIRLMIKSAKPALSVMTAYRSIRAHMLNWRICWWQLIVKGLQWPYPTAWLPLRWSSMKNAVLKFILSMLTVLSAVNQNREKGKRSRCPSLSDSQWLVDRAYPFLKAQNFGMVPTGIRNKLKLFDGPLPLLPSQINDISPRSASWVRTCMIRTFTVCNWRALAISVILWEWRRDFRKYSKWQVGYYVSSITSRS